jgi:hypothetical protein
MNCRTLSKSINAPSHPMHTFHRQVIRGFIADHSAPYSVNFHEQYGVPGSVSGGHDKHVVIIRASMVRANRGNSTIPTDLQGNSGIPFLFRAVCTRQVFVVTMRVFLSGRWISSLLRSVTSRFLNAISRASRPPLSGRTSRSFIRRASITANCSQTSLSPL